MRFAAELAALFAISIAMIGGLYATFNLNAYVAKVTHRVWTGWLVQAVALALYCAIIASMIGVTSLECSAWAEGCSSDQGPNADWP